jgi:hypothetical protein
MLNRDRSESRNRRHQGRETSCQRSELSQKNGGASAAKFREETSKAASSAAEPNIALHNAGRKCVLITIPIVPAEAVPQSMHSGRAYQSVSFPNV